MVTKEGQYRAKLPTQYRSNRKKVDLHKKFIIKNDYKTGTQHLYKIKTCPNCGKKRLKMKSIEIDTGSNHNYELWKCDICGYTNTAKVENKDNKIET